MPEYKIEIEPATRMDWLLRDRPCLRVCVTTNYPYDYIGTERTKHVDQDEARALAAAMISRWEEQASTVVL